MAPREQDPLTRLATKEHFDRAVAEHMNGESAPGSVSVAFLDVDQFLHVNEKSGREAGDQVLVELAALFKRAVTKPGDTFRIGGDEFAVLMPGTEKERAFLQLEHLRGEFEALGTLGGIEPHPSISIGIATYPDDGATSQEVLRKADDALFRAKGAGRNRIALAREERKVPKTSHYTQGQLERLSVLANKQGVSDAELLREALDDLLKKYSS